MKNFIVNFIFRLFGTKSASGVFSVKDANRIIFILIVATLAGNGVDLGINEISHYTETIQEHKQEYGGDFGKQLTYMISFVLSEYMRRKIVNAPEYEVVEPQPIKGRKPRK